MNILPKGANPKQASWNIKVGDTIEFILNHSQGKKLKKWDAWRQRVLKGRKDNHESMNKFTGIVSQIFVGDFVDENGLGIERDGGELRGDDILILKKKSIFFDGKRIANSYFRTYNPKTKRASLGDYTYGVQRRDVKQIVEKKKKKKKKKKTLRRSKSLPKKRSKKRSKKKRSLRR